MTIEPAAPRVRVLLAEDDPDLRAVLAEALLERGCSVIEASDGCQAITSAVLQRFDVAVLDIEMPCLDGTVVLRALRRMGDIGRLYLFTGSPDDLRIPVGTDAPDGVFAKSRGVAPLLRTVCPNGCGLDREAAADA